jgi:hypothetical protein
MVGVVICSQLERSDRACRQPLADIRKKQMGIYADTAAQVLEKEGDEGCANFSKGFETPKRSAK